MEGRAAQDLIEYVLLIAHFALAAAVGIKSLGAALNIGFGKLATSLTAAT